MADEKKSKTGLYIVGGFILLLIVAGAIYMFSKSSTTSTTTTTQTGEQSNSGLGGILGSLNLSGLHIFGL